MAMKLPPPVPILASIRPFDGGTIFSVKLVIAVPFPRTIHPFNGRAILAMKLTVKEPLSGTVSELDCRSVFTMMPAFAAPYLRPISPNGGRTILSVKLAKMVPLSSSVIPFDGGADASMYQTALDMNGAPHLLRTVLFEPSIRDHVSGRTSEKHPETYHCGSVIHRGAITCRHASVTVRGDLGDPSPFEMESEMRTTVGIAERQDRF
jgi:hypothetical protein